MTDVAPPHLTDTFIERRNQFVVDMSMLTQEALDEIRQAASKPQHAKLTSVNKRSQAQLFEQLHDLRQTAARNLEEATDIIARLRARDMTLRQYLTPAALAALELGLRTLQAAPDTLATANRTLGLARPPIWIDGDTFFAAERTLSLLRSLTKA